MDAILVSRAFARALVVSILAVSCSLVGCGGGGSGAPAPTASTVPTGLLALGGPGQVGLTWSAPDDDGNSAITDYRIYRGTASGELTAVGDVGGAATRYTDTGLTNGTTYLYAVAAVNGAGESAPSDEASATPLAAPGAPTGLQAVAGAGQVGLTWTAPLDDGGTAVTDYRVCRGTASGSVSAIFFVGGTATTYTDTGLTNGQEYFYAVAAVNVVGEGARSAEDSATPRSAPGAPTGLVASAGAGQVNLSWTAPIVDGGSAVTNYRVYAGATFEGLSPIGDVGGTGTTYTATALTNGATYFFAVAAVNAEGEGPRSAERSATPATSPGAPSGLVATAGAGQVGLSWTAPTDDGGRALTNYRVYRGTSSSILNPIGYVGTTGTTYTDTGLTNGTEYFYAVAAVTVVGEGAQSAEDSATPLSAPGAPTGLSATAGVGQVSLSWTAPADDGGTAVTGYRVHRGTAAGSVSVVFYVAGTGTTYTDAGLTAGTEYFYTVVAVNAVGEGAPSAEDSATPPRVPGAPTGLELVAGAGEVGLTWTAPADDGGAAITAYRVYRGTASGSLVLLGATAGSETYYVDESVRGGTGYFYAVSAVNAVGEGPRSDEGLATALLLGVATVTVPAGTFMMGRTGLAEPVHQVTLSAYEIGKFEVTNGEFADVLNWALAKGYLEGDAAGSPYVAGDVYAGGQLLLSVTDSMCPISFVGGEFTVETRTASSGTVSMADHPVVDVTWFGAVAFCNWLSESTGLNPWYDLTTWERTAPSPDGFRLPTEAEWERAAAWDAGAEPAKAWFYGCMADDISTSRCNYVEANPLGLTSPPPTTPVGYYDGLNSGTVDSPSPVGCYDMSGNAWEWCHDRYAPYTADAQWDPTGDDTAVERAVRGGSWLNDAIFSNTAFRMGAVPTTFAPTLGFRVVLSPSRGE